MSDKIVNAEFVLECERILQKARKGEYQGMCAIFLNAYDGTSCDFVTSKGLNHNWLVGMLFRFQMYLSTNESTVKNL